MIFVPHTLVLYFLAVRARITILVVHKLHAMANLTKTGEFIESGVPFEDSDLIDGGSDNDEYKFK